MGYQTPELSSGCCKFLFFLLMCVCDISGVLNPDDVEYCEKKNSDCPDILRFFDGVIKVAYRFDNEDLMNSIYMILFMYCDYICLLYIVLLYIFQHFKLN